MCGIFNYRHAHVISNNQSVLIFTGRFLAPHVSIYSRWLISKRHLRLCNLCIEIQQSDRRRATIVCPARCRGQFWESWSVSFFLQLAYSSEFSMFITDSFFFAGEKSFPYWSTFCIVTICSHEWIWAYCSSSLMNIFIQWFWCHIQQTSYAVNIFSSYMYAVSSVSFWLGRKFAE